MKYTFFSKLVSYWIIIWFFLTYSMPVHHIVRWTPNLSKPLLNLIFLCFTLSTSQSNMLHYWVALEWLQTRIFFPWLKGITTTQLILPDTADIPQISDRHALADEGNDATVRRHEDRMHEKHVWEVQQNDRAQRRTRCDFPFQNQERTYCSWVAWSAGQLRFAWSASVQNKR